MSDFLKKLADLAWTAEMSQSFPHEVYVTLRACPTRAVGGATRAGEATSVSLQNGDHTILRRSSKACQTEEEVLAEAAALVEEFAIGGPDHPELW